VQLLDRLELEAKAVAAAKAADAAARKRQRSPEADGSDDDDDVGEVAAPRRPTGNAVTDALQPATAGRGDGVLSDDVANPATDVNEVPPSAPAPPPRRPQEEEEPEVWVQRLLRGAYTETVLCRCGSALERHDKSYVISVAMPTRPRESVQDMLAASLRPDLVDFYKCDACGREKTSTQSCRFEHLPPVLLLQLKRFYTKRIPGGVSIHKNDIAVTLSRHLAIPVGAGQSNRYELVGVVDHKGETPQSGHYVAYYPAPGREAGTAEERERPQWHGADDERIAPLAQPPYKETSTSCYLLAYKLTSTV
jgi:hypothetical protein